MGSHCHRSLLNFSNLFVSIWKKLEVYELYEFVSKINKSLELYNRTYLSTAFSSTLIFQTPWRSLRTNFHLTFAAVITNGIPDLDLWKWIEQKLSTALDETERIQRTFFKSSHTQTYKTLPWFVPCSTPVPKCIFK